MEKLNFDTGVRAYRLGSGVLRFNPTDPNLYARFLDALDTIAALESELQPQTGEEAIRALAEADGRIKGILTGVFGGDNDFSRLLDGVNLLAVGDNGQRLITNLFDALEPVLTAGARRCAQSRAKAL